MNNITLFLDCRLALKLLRLVYKAAIVWGAFSFKGGQNMKCLFMIYLVGAVSLISMAQIPTNSQELSGISVGKVQWFYEVDWRPAATDNSTQRNGELRTLDQEMALRYQKDRNASSVEVKNVGSKTIRRIKYDFLFVDPVNGKELLRYRLRTKADIAPGQTKVLRNVIADDRAERFRPLGGIFGVARAEYKVQIQEVEFSDGSTWHRP